MLFLLLALMTPQDAPSSPAGLAPGQNGLPLVEIPGPIERRSTAAEADSSLEREADGGVRSPGFRVLVPAMPVPAPE